MIVAAADTTGAGCVELWISCELRVLSERIFVLHATPRLLLVKLAWDGRPLCFAVARAPDVASGEEVALQWWADTARTV
jgi:hypothetical protein